MFWAIMLLLSVKWTKTESTVYCSLIPSSSPFSLCVSKGSAYFNKAISSWSSVFHASERLRSQWMNAVNSFISLFQGMLSACLGTQRPPVRLYFHGRWLQRFTRFVMRCVFVSLFSFKLEFSFKIKALLPFPSK